MRICSSANMPWMKASESPTGSGFLKSRGKTMLHECDIKEEEARRTRNWDAQQRWKAILQTIEWAEAQLPEKRNSKKACLERQALLNRSR